MRLESLITLLTAILISGVSFGQQPVYIDLSSIHEPLAEELTKNSMIEAYSCVGSKGVTAQQATISLEWMETTDFYPNERVPAEFRVENTGSTPLKLPIHPTLRDLLPQNGSKPFVYYHLTLGLVAGVPAEGAALVIGGLELYGSLKKGDTLVSVPPGESIRVKGNVRIRRWYKRDQAIAVAPGLTLSQHGFPDRQSVRVTSSDQKCRLEISESGPQLHAFMHSRPR